MARMQARYPGQCYVCGERIRAGAWIDYNRAAGGARHDGCTPYTPPADAIYVSIGAGYGGQPFQVGQIIRNLHHDHPMEEVILRGLPTEAQEQQRQRETPEYLYVLHGEQRYYYHDGYSFGVGDEAGYIYGAYCRAATEEESAELRAAEATQAQRTAAREALAALTERIRREGEYPRPAQPAAGYHELLNTRTIYGGGSRYLIADGEVWYCQGNGGDGDDWSASNLGSEIACRLADPDGSVATELEHLAGIIERKIEQKSRVSA